jgi:peptide/nickel transport system substrate-binding protein
MNRGLKGALWAIGMGALLTGIGCVERPVIPANTLVIALESAPSSLDPRLPADSVSSKIRGLLYAGLMRRDDDFTLVPDLAESYEIQTDTRYRLTLRNGLTFHDGTPLTAATIKANYEYILDEKNKSPYRSGLMVIGKIETPDELTIVFHLTEPSAPFLGALTIGIVPQNAGPEISEQPVGAGPFVFVRYTLDERLTLRGNKNYHGGAPKLDGVVFKIIPDETVRTLELETGGVHLITNPITPDLLPRFEKNKNLQVIKNIGTNYSYLGFNLDDPVTGDHQVREAIAHAIDREAIITHIMKGLGAKADGLLSPVNEFYYGDVTSYEFDPERAKKILDDAGYHDPDGEGPLHRFTIEYATSTNEQRKRIAEVFQFQLAKVGIGIDIKSYEWGSFFANVKEGRFQMFSLTWVGVSEPDIYHYIFHTASLPPAGANRGRYRNQRVDALLDAGRVTIDTAQRKKIYATVQEIVAAALPYVSLWYTVNVVVANQRVHGFMVAPDENLFSLTQVTMVPEGSTP